MNLFPSREKRLNEGGNVIITIGAFQYKLSVKVDILKFEMIWI